MTITTAAVGPIATTQELLRTMLADCYYFQEWTGSANAAAALARIYHEGLPEPADGEAEHTVEGLEELRPFAYLHTNGDGGLELTSIGDGFSFTYRHQGILLLHLEQTFPAGEDRDQAERVWQNHLGRIIQSGDGDKPGLAELSGQPGYLPINRFELFQMGRSAENEVKVYGDVQFARIVIHWGVR